MNNHPFLKSVSSDGSLPLCALCNQPESQHPPFIECQICGKLDFCTPYLTFKMCASCKSNESKLQEISLQQANQRIVESIKSSSNLDNVTEVIKLREDYFNADTMSFAELHRQIPNEYEYACAVQSRIEHLQQVLLPNSKKQVEEFQNELYAAQRILNDTVAKIEEEKRKEFTSANINYVPPSIKVSGEKKIKVPTIKSKDPVDRLVAMYMQTMEKRGTPIQPLYEAYHDGKMLVRTKDHSLAEIKARESGGSVKVITAFDRAKLIVTNQSEHTENEQ